MLESGGFQQKIRYLNEINSRYDSLANNTSAEVLVQLRLLRSLWAKRIAQRLIQSVPAAGANELEQICKLIAFVRTLIGPAAVSDLIDRQRLAGDLASGHAVAALLAEHASPEDARHRIDGSSGFQIA